MDKVIYIKKGYGDIQFDMSVEEVIALMGPADEVEAIENASDETTTVIRYGDAVTFFFEGENPVLTCIDITDEDALLFDKEVFGLNEKEIVGLMVNNHFYEQDIDNEEWGERRITFYEGNIDFYFEDDELMSISIGK